MKNILAATLATLCASALASPSTNVADFDIEGFKLGMSKEETIMLLKEKCKDGKFKEKDYSDKQQNIFESKKLTCELEQIHDKKIYEDIVIIANDKILVIEGLRAVEYSENLPEIDRKNLNNEIYNKLLEKYGDPHRKIFAGEKKISSVSFASSKLSNPDIAACWGDCFIKDSSHYESIESRKYSFFAIQISEREKAALVGRVLADVESIKSASDKSIEEAKTQSKQAAENIKF